MSAPRTARLTWACPGRCRGPGGRPGGPGLGTQRWYVPGRAALNLEPKAEPAEVTVRLRRGAKVKVRLLDPDGQPVSQARFLCRLPVASLGYQQLYPAEARDGWLEL